MFQKMSGEELELRARDAEMRRRQMVTDREERSPAEESLHPTTDKEFKQRYGGSLYQEENNNPSQIQPTNVQVERKENSSGKKRRKKITFFQGKQQTEDPQSNNFGGIWGNRNKTIHKTSSSSEGGVNEKGAIEKSLDVYGKTAGRGLMTAAHAWTLFIYFTFQIWLGIIAVIAIALVFAIEYYVGSGITRAAFDTLMTAIGVNWDFYLVALLCYMMVVTVCYVQLFGVAIQAKTLGLHPLGGSGSFFKTGSFLLCFVLYWIPIINCLPLVNIYIFSIQAYPR